MTRVYNFSAGPSVMPVPVLEEAQKDLLDYKGAGMSVMEMSHRSKDYQQIIDTTVADLRELLSIPENYKVIFMQGGATGQFAAVPMNLLKNGAADYIVTGNWSASAAKECGKYGTANVLADTKDTNYTVIPDVDSLAYNDDADYTYICENETIYGVKYPKLPQTKAPLVSDVSSMFLSEKHDIEKYGLLYGGVQKNIGPAGLAIIIVREDLLRDDICPYCPTILNYKKNEEKGSMLNTPNTWSIYMCGLTLKWLKEQGGLDAMRERNEKKAALVYDYLDNSKMFKANVQDKAVRSLMNIPFVTGNDELDAKFIAESTAAGLKSLKGHRSVGGMRASIYNAMPVEGVQALVDFMEKFEKENS